MKKIFRSIILTSALSLSLASCGNSLSQDGPIYHVVCFDSDGGTEIPDQRVKHGEKITRPDDPVKAGFTFQRWKYANEEWSFAGYVVTEDMTLKAEYFETEYWIEFINPNQPSGFFYCSNIPNMSKRRKYGDIITLRAMPLAGYTFDGFYDDETFLSRDLDYTFSVSKSMNISAKWKVGASGYGIDINELEHGRVEITKSRAYAGETIIVKAIPDEGYRTYSMYRGKYVATNGGRTKVGEDYLLSDDHDISIVYQNGYYGHSYTYAWDDYAHVNAAWPGVENNFHVNFYELNKGRSENRKFTHFIISDDYYQTDNLLISDFERFGSISIERATKSTGSTYYKATAQDELQFFDDDGTFSFKVSQSCYVGATFREI